LENSEGFSDEDRETILQIARKSLIPFQVQPVHKEKQQDDLGKKPEPEPKVPKDKA